MKAKQLYGPVKVLGTIANGSKLIETMSLSDAISVDSKERIIHQNLS